MCLDVDADTLREELPHNPNEVYWEEVAGINGLRGIQIEDLLPIIYSKGYIAMPFFTKSTIQGKEIRIPICYEALNHRGIFMYPDIRHVVAWDGKMIYDPRGLIYQIKIGWEEFWIIEPR